jgi:uncharacterized protein YecE (DUF72 family)
MRILTGTASWTDPTLIACGRFYPPAARSAEDRLRYYATQFPVTEVDSSYYALPDPATAWLWAQRTPDDFVIDIKAFRLFTGHGAAPRALPADIRRELKMDDGVTLYDHHLPGELRDELWRRFTYALEPLRASGKLGTVLCQFAPWVTADRRGHARVADCMARLEGVDTAVELRHRSWFDGAQANATLAFERDLGAVHVVVDSPQGATNSVPAVWETTRDDLAVVRLHGRNAAAWNKRGLASSSGRFIYEYSDEEADALAKQIAALAKRVSETHVLLNTNYQDQGVNNARRLGAALGRLAGA